MRIRGNGRRLRLRWTEIAGGLTLASVAIVGGMGQANPPAAPASSPAAAAAPDSSGCGSRPTQTDSASAHESTAVKISCVTCHGGNGQILAPPGSAPGNSAYEKAKRQAH